MDGGDTIITSVDPGSTNCGVAKYSVARDRFLFLDLADLRTSRAGDIVDKLHQYRVHLEPDSFSGTDMVVVERQMGNNPCNMCVETTLRADWRGRCICVAPQTIMDHFGVPRGTPRPEKKKMMVRLMRELLTAPENAMIERVVEARRSANRKARQEHKTRLRQAKGRKRKRLPKLELPYPRIKYDDVLEAAAQALWAAEDISGRKVRRRRRHSPKDARPASSRRRRREVVVVSD